jgi:hypothetical protein
MWCGGEVVLVFVFWGCGVWQSWWGVFLCSGSGGGGGGGGGLRWCFDWVFFLGLDSYPGAPERVGYVDSPC